MHIYFEENEELFMLRLPSLMADLVFVSSYLIAILFVSHNKMQHYRDEGSFALTLKAKRFTRKFNR